MNEREQILNAIKKATGPDRELDCLIFEARHQLLTPARRGTYYGEPTGEYFDLDGNPLPERAPHYTGSLDAAASLIPKDHDWIIEHVNGGLTIGARVGHNDPDRTSWGETAVLALCHAALSAEARL